MIGRDRRTSHLHKVPIKAEEKNLSQLTGKRKNKLLDRKFYLQQTN
jgi:hypothetical protein